MRRLNFIPRVSLAVRRTSRAVEKSKEQWIGIVVATLPNWLRPNHITWFRLLGVCPTLAASLLLGWPRWATVAIAAVGFISDGLDGTMARLRGQTSAPGATLDAIADKLLVIPALWILGLAKLEPTIFWLLLARDATIVGYTLVALSSREKLKVRSSRPGKWYMAAVFCLLLLMLLNAPQLPTNAVGSLAVIIGWISLPYYWRR